MSDWCVAWADVADLACSASPAAAEALVVANDVLFELSGHRFTGACSHTVRPTVTSGGCSGSTGTPPSGWWSDPYYAVDLGLFPIREVTQVRVNGLVLNDDTYRVDQQRYLVRIGEPWPNVQERAKPPDQVNTWEVRLSVGEDPPAAGVLALRELACELVAAADGDETCRLPQRVTSVTRQGVAYVMTDLMEFLSEGRTGLYDVDLFLSTYNPGHNLDRPIALLPYDIPGSVDV